MYILGGEMTFMRY